MAPDGVETSLFEHTVFPEGADVDFSFGTLGMGIFKFKFIHQFLVATHVVG